MPHPTQHSTVTRHPPRAPWAAAPQRSDLTDPSPQAKQLTKLLTTAAETLQSLGRKDRGRGEAA